MINARQFLDSVELFSAFSTESDYGKEIITYISEGIFPANVEILSGTRALYYQQEGNAYPIIIKIRKVDFEIKKIVYNKSTITPRSIVTTDAFGKSNFRGEYLIITGSYLTTNVDIVATATTSMITTTSQL